MKGLYLQASGEMAIIFLQPGDDYYAVCTRVTPHGVPFLIVEDSALPADWSISATWGADFSSPHGMGIGPHRCFISSAEAEIARVSAIPEPAEPTPIIAATLGSEDFPDGATDEQKLAIQDAHNQAVADENERQAAAYAFLMAAYQAVRDLAISNQQSLMSRMKAEVLLIEGVQL